MIADHLALGQRKREFSHEYYILGIRQLISEAGRSEEEGLPGRSVKCVSSFLFKEINYEKCVISGTFLSTMSHRVLTRDV